MGASVRMEKGDTKVNAIRGPSFPRRVSSQRGGQAGGRRWWISAEVRAGYPIDGRIGDGYDFLFGQYKRHPSRDYETALTAIWDNPARPRRPLSVSGIAVASSRNTSLRTGRAAAGWFNKNVKYKVAGGDGRLGNK